MLISLKLTLAGIIVPIGLMGAFVSMSKAATLPLASTLIYPVADSSALPVTVFNLKYTAINSVNQSTHTVAHATLPGWSPTMDTAGSVTTGGDIALIDTAGASTNTSVSIFITNLAMLQADYTSFALPVTVYSSTCADSACAWSPYAQESPSSTNYLTSTSGFLTFTLAPGKYYDVTIGTGGSYFCDSTAESNVASLAPTFYLSADA